MTTWVNRHSEAWWEANKALKRVQKKIGSSPKPSKPHPAYPQSSQKTDPKLLRDSLGRTCHLMMMVEFSMQLGEKQARVTEARRGLPTHALHRSEGFDVL